jgi:indoleacetamide hydrolase
MRHLHELGVVEAASAIRAGDIKAEALAAALLQRAQALGSLNAFVTLDADTILAAARAADQRRAAGKPLGLLDGVPIALKDNINTAAFPTTAGTPGIKADRFDTQGMP